jgi:hypothetical protein
LKVVKAKEKVLFPARIGRRKDDLTVLSLREEQRRVNAIANEKDAKPGCRYYIISQEWFGRWRAWVEVLLSHQHLATSPHQPTNQPQPTTAIGLIIMLSCSPWYIERAGYR